MNNDIDWIEVNPGVCTVWSGVKPGHCFDVQLTKRYWISSDKVTWGVWEKYIGDNRWADIWKQLGISIEGCNHYPVMPIRLDEVALFLERYRLATGTSVYLPTDAEWCYACMGSSKEDNYWTAVSSEPVSEDLARKYAPILNGDEMIKIGAVRQYPPNRLGIYDMLGLSWEWTRDSYNVRSVITVPSIKEFPKNGSLSVNYHHSGGTHNVTRGAAGSTDAASLSVKTVSYCCVPSIQTSFRMVRYE